MVKLRDIIDLIWVDGDKPIDICTPHWKILTYGINDISEVLACKVIDIEIYDSSVLIDLGE